MLRDLFSVFHIFDDFTFFDIFFCTVDVDPPVLRVTLDRFTIIFNFKCAYPAFFHTEFVESFDVKVLNLVRKKIKKNDRLMNKQKQK